MVIVGTHLDDKSVNKTASAAMMEKIQTQFSQKHASAFLLLFCVE